MAENEDIKKFLSQYGESVVTNAFTLRKVILKSLPGVIEQIDKPARMIAYTYGQRYTEMICTLIPSQKGIKLGFYKGTDLPDPENLLKGEGKISRYVEIKQKEDIRPLPLTTLLKHALLAYKSRMAV